MNKLLQIPEAILMVRPASFGFNPETAQSNAFQQIETSKSQSEIQTLAQEEFDGMVQLLKDHDIKVIKVEDTPTPVKTDAIFPNNWVSFHHDGTAVLYPMESPMRRQERRKEVLDTVSHQGYFLNKVIDLSTHENEHKYLEGTGSIVFDYSNKVAYACISSRTDEKVLHELCKEINFEPVQFHASDKNGLPIYHTNVLMCVADEYAVICLEAIKDVEQRQFVTDKLKQGGHEIVEINMHQLYNFAGNMLQVQNMEGKKYLVMSRSAFSSLNEDQLATLGEYNHLIVPTISTIEKLGGGSVRCMMAGIFLPGV